MVSSHYKLCNNGSNAAEIGKGHNLAVPVSGTPAQIKACQDVLISLILVLSRVDPVGLLKNGA